MRERKTTRTVLGRGLLLVLVLAAAVFIALYARKGGTTGDGIVRSDALEPWRLDPAPLMSVGDTEADPLFEVVGIAITPSHVVIAQEGEGTLRFYDQMGTLERVVGGRGEGPGEYGELDWMKRSGDFLFAYDRYGREISRFSLDGRLLGSVALSPPEEYLVGLSARGVFSDGSVLAEVWDALFWPTEPAVERLTLPLLLFD